MTSTGHTPATPSTTPDVEIIAPAEVPVSEEAAALWAEILLDLAEGREEDAQ